MNKPQLKSILIISLIILLGLFLRLIGINKPGGLWHDEMVIYTQSIQAFPWDIINWTLSRDTHFPLFQLLLHLWMTLFGNNDITIRLFSVLIGVANIYVIYLAGKELESKRTGIIAALALSINSLLIYYSQEVKFYSFLPLFATISALFLIRIIKKPTKINYWGFIISNLLISYTFTIGIAYVFIEIATLATYLYLKQKEDFKRFIKTHLYFLILLIPLIFMFLRTLESDKQDFTGGFTAFYQDIQFIIVILQNWFTPVLIGLINNPVRYLDILLYPNLLIVKLLFIFVPFVCYLIGIINAIRQKNYTLMLLIISLSFLFLEIAATLVTRFVCITRYTIIGLPLIILFASYGIAKIKNTKFLYSIVTIFTLLNIFFILAYPFSAPKQPRTGGHKLPSVALEKISNLKDGDILVFPLRATLFTKYADVKGTKLSVFRNFIINRDFLNTIIDPEDVHKLNANNCQKLFKNYIYQRYASDKFIEYFENKIYSKIPQKGTFVIVINKDMTYPRNTYQYVLTQNQYYDTPFVFMLLSKVTYDLIDISTKYFHSLKVYKIDSWEIYVFHKS